MQLLKKSPSVENFTDINLHNENGCAVERVRAHGFTGQSRAAIVLTGIVRYSLGELEPAGDHGEGRGRGAGR